MGLERQGNEEVRELRLEGLGLAIAGVVLLLLLAGAFMAGRWVERDGRPEGAAIVGSDPLGNVSESAEAIDVSDTLDHFDRPTGAAAAKVSEREVRRDEPAADTARPADGGAAGGAQPSGPWWVQVAAGRDLVAAESLVAKLGGEGFTARIFTERAAGDVLYKVRVGGFSDEDGARGAVGTLEGRGYRGAFPTRLD